MIQLLEGGAYLVNGTEVIPDTAQALDAVKSKVGGEITKEAAREATMAYGILKEHNTSGNMEKLKIKFDKLSCLEMSLIINVSGAYSEKCKSFKKMFIQSLIFVYRHQQLKTIH